MLEIDKIAIVGAGNLGSRHLQAMAFTKRLTWIVVIDPSEESLRIAQKRWEEMEVNPLVKECIFSTNMENLPEELDVVVVATSSAPRRVVVENLLSKCKVRYLVLEKVLFQKLEDYSAIGSILQEKNVPTWVNCSRRNMDFYKKLQEMLIGDNHVAMSVTGGNWGLGCNSIHMLDVFAFITGQKDFNANNFFLDGSAIDSKRKGYIEFTGELRIESPKGLLSFISYNDGNRPLTISIDSENVHIEIDEMNRFARILRQNRGIWKWEKVDIDIKRQSEMTHKLVQELMEKGNCGLPSYEESANLHKVLLKAFLAHLSEVRGENCKICPIT